MFIQVSPETALKAKTPHLVYKQKKAKNLTAIWFSIYILLLKIMQVSLKLSWK